MSLASRIALRTGFVLIVVLAAGAALATAGFFVAKKIYEGDLPSVEAVQELPLQVPLRIYTRDGKLIGEFGAERRDPLDYAELPKPLIEAFIAAEDARFFEHPGVDWQGILRAGINLMLTGERSQGGSTITMQLARNFFLTRERTYERKIREIFLALRMEEVLSKEQILESYLNKIYLGERAYGVGAAAKVYFGQPVAELSVSQMAVLAGLPKAPSRDNPVNDPERALERRDYVLGRMHDLGYIDDAALQRARAEPVIANPERADVDVDAHFVAEMVRQEMIDRYGDAAYTDGYRVTTTIDSRQQKAATNALRRHLREHSARQGYRTNRPMIAETVRDELGGEPLAEAVITGINELPRLAGLTRAVVLSHDAEGMQLTLATGDRARLTPEDYDWAELGDTRLTRGALVYLENRDGEGDEAEVDPEQADWRLAAEPIAQGAVVAMRPDSGAITALVGGYDFFDGRFNRAIQAERQPGSAIKPIIYAAALDQGFTPASVLIDAPIVMEDYALEAKWRPRNYSGRFHGPTRLREALVHSRNIISIKLLRSIGVEVGRNYATRFGLPLERMPNNLSLALGSPVFTPLEMSRAFATFANGGHLVDPYFIARIDRAEENARPIVTPIPPLCDNPLPATFEYEATRAQDATEDEAEGEAEDLVPATISMPVPTSAALPSERRKAEGALPPAPLEVPGCLPRTVNERVAWMTADMMRDVTRRGTGARATRLGRSDIAGKTGTTNDEADAWFVGIQRELAAAVWIGHDQPRRLGRGEGGSRAALPVWIDFMNVALEGVPQGFMPRPEGLIDVRIDADSGLIAHPDAESVVFETLPEERLPDMEHATSSEPGGSALDALY
ncbi:penicillin-binding protein 1A [Algiphilus aromaticivorans]|uniref:penicillin-binding protein 1A n=1 Tax=Algiphilus aromaticivorans TaxID=382454 RepID=UPI0006947D43|nr:transglycosylase domain-containing protein [Algiphilus aromaticivorans]